MLFALMKHEIPAPEVGRDLVLGQETVGNAELCWPEHEVAVICEGEAVPEIPGWTLIRASGADVVGRVLDALSVGKAR